MKPSIAREAELARGHYLVLTLLATVASVSALLYYSGRGQMLLYGDAVAHINIARRVFDSRTPGLVQLGTVWLPLPHLLEIPFLMNDRMWQTGLGGSLVSVLAYVAGTVGIFRLVGALASRSAAWLAAAIYALNPNLLYMQSTAMTESLYLALFIWSIVHFSQFVQQLRNGEQKSGAKALQRCAITVSAAMLVRYDGWFLAAMLGGGVLVTAAVSPVFDRQQSTGSRGRAYSFKDFRRGNARTMTACFLLPFLTATLWLAYNRAVYGNALEFANGQYSAKAIMQRTRPASMPSYPGEHSPRTSALYFLKVSRLNLGENGLENAVFGLAFVSLVGVAYFGRRMWPAALLWVPVPFYVFSIAWGSVPIYFNQWWPFSYYNVRYGLQMLPAGAVFLALGFHLLSQLLPARAIATALLAVVAAGYYSSWRVGPICLREAVANGTSRLMFERAVARELSKLPASATLLMDCSSHAGAAQLAGIPFRFFIRETATPDWQQALTHPAASADYVVAFSNDEVFHAVRLFSQHLRPIVIIDTPGQGTAWIYAAIR